MLTENLTETLCPFLSSMARLIADSEEEYVDVGKGVNLVRAAAVDEPKVQ